MVALLGAAAPGTVAAQRYWLQSFYPVPYYTLTDGFWLSGLYTRWSPVGFEEQPEPFLAAWTLSAGLSAEGSYLAAAEYHAPDWWDGWRIRVTATAARANRQAYHGIGNETPYFADSTGTAAQPYLYQVSRSTQTARATIQRRIAGGLRALAGATYTRTDYRPLPGESQISRDIASGAIDSSAYPLGDLAARFGLVFDARDHEIDPHSGVLVEALFTAGEGYQRVTGSANVYVRPFKRLTLAARLLGEDVSGTPPLPVQSSIETSERAINSLGGYRSLRAYNDVRFIGPGKLIGGIEARYVIRWSPTIYEVKIVGFYEAGRVFAPGEAWRLTTDGLHPSWGGEVAVRLLRNGLFTTGVATGEEGTRFMLATGWSF